MKQDIFSSGKCNFFLVKRFGLLDDKKVEPYYLPELKHFSGIIFLLIHLNVLHQYFKSRFLAFSLLRPKWLMLILDSP